ncbi:hypothetical protein EV122DRAFT_279341 [Schizophyllum commune]
MPQRTGRSVDPLGVLYFDFRCFSSAPILLRTRPVLWRLGNPMINIQLLDLHLQTLRKRVKIDVTQDHQCDATKVHQCIVDSSKAPATGKPNATATGQFNGPLDVSVNMMLRKSIDTGVPQEHLYPPAENTNAPTSSPNVAPDTASLNDLSSIASRRVRRLKQRKSIVMTPQVDRPLPNALIPDIDIFVLDFDVFSLDIDRREDRLSEERRTNTDFVQ